MSPTTAERIRQRIADGQERFPVTPELLPVVVIGLRNLLAGFITLAPLHQRVLGIDSTDPQMIQAQIRYLKHMARDLSRLGELES